MTKKRRPVHEELIAGGFGLSLGSSVVGALPASAAQAGVQEGLGAAGGFFKPIATIGAAGIVMKQLKGIPKRDGSGRGTRENRGRGGCEPPRDRGIKLNRRNLW